MHRIAVPLCLLASCTREDAPVEVEPAVLDQLDELAGCRDAADNAWPQWEQVLRRFREPAKDTHYACCNVPGAPGWPLLGEWLQANRDLLPLIEQATRKKHFGMCHHPVTGQNGCVRYVELGKTRMLVNLLCAASREAEANGDLDLAMAHVDSAARLGLQVAARPLIIDRFIGCAVTGIAARELRRLTFANAGKWTEAQLAAFAHSPLLRFEGRPVAETLRAERLLGEPGPELEGWVHDTEDNALAQVRLMRVVLALVVFRHAHGHFPASIEELGSDVASTPRLRYLPPCGARGPVLYELREDGRDPFAGREPDVWDPMKITDVHSVAPPR